MLTCERASVVLRGLEKNELVVEAEEIDELLALGLAVEADPDDLSTVQWLAPVVREFTRREIGDALAIQSLQTSLQETEREVNNDWYQMTTGKPERARREQDRVTMRRALAFLRDKTVVLALSKIVTDSAALAPNARYVCCAQLGAEHYALTHKGWRVRRSLKVRLERFGKTPFKTFLHTFDKTEGKMRAFGMEITTLSRNIGYVKKNREQIVIGLAKTGVPAGHALGAYHAALQEVQAPDVAVTCARNAATFGSPVNAAQRLRVAQAALQRAGLPGFPVVMGAAKSLLAFDPPDAGVPRFLDLVRRLEHIFGRRESVYKHTARLMPAAGTPADVVGRVITAGHLLKETPTRLLKGASQDQQNVGVALASMARTADALPALVTRYREIELELVRGDVSQPPHVESDALECVGCPGAPSEVVDIVAVLVEQIAVGRPPQRGDVAIAVSFAKRFAY